MDPAEDVPLSVYLPGIDFVEQSHHDEGVEDHCEVQVVFVVYLKFFDAH